MDQLSEGRLVLGVGVAIRATPASRTSEGKPMLASAPASSTRGSRCRRPLTGEPFSFRGAHFTIEEVTFRPPPVQRPRPPIWIGGGYPNPRAIERSLRWDGTCMYRRAGGPLLAEDVRDLRARAGERRWDIAVGGWERRDDLEEELEHRRSVSEAGADWWVEWVAPAERAEMARAVVRGPLRVDQV